MSEYTCKECKDLGAVGYCCPCCGKKRKEDKFEPKAKPVKSVIPLWYRTNLWNTKDYPSNYNKDVLKALSQVYISFKETNTLYSSYIVTGRCLDVHKKWAFTLGSFFEKRGNYITTLDNNDIDNIINRRFNKDNFLRTSALEHNFLIVLIEKDDYYNTDIHLDFVMRIVKARAFKSKSTIILTDLDVTHLECNTKDNDKLENPIVIGLEEVENND